MGDAQMNGPAPFGITSRRMGNVLIVALTGELDAGTVELFDQTIREAEVKDSEMIFLDLRELSFIDSTGLSALLQARERCDRLRFLPSDHDQVTSVIAITGSDKALGYPLVGGSAG